MGQDVPAYKIVSKGNRNSFATAVVEADKVERGGPNERDVYRVLNGEELVAVVPVKRLMFIEKVTLQSTD